MCSFNTLCRHRSRCPCRHPAPRHGFQFLHHIAGIGQCASLTLSVAIAAYHDPLLQVDTRYSGFIYQRFEEASHVNPTQHVTWLGRFAHQGRCPPRGFHQWHSVMEVHNQHLVARLRAHQKAQQKQQVQLQRRRVSVLDTYKGSCCDGGTVYWKCTTSI